MNYKRMRVTGKSKKNGKEGEIVVNVPITATNEHVMLHQEVLDKLDSPYIVNELPFDPPTDKQLAYAKDLGILVPKQATKEDVSVLISRKVDDSDERNP